MENIKMRYSIEPRNRICVKRYAFYSLPKTWVKV